VVGGGLVAVRRLLHNDVRVHSQRQNVIHIAGGAYYLKGVGGRSFCNDRNCSSSRCAFFYDSGKNDGYCWARGLRSCIFVSKSMLLRDDAVLLSGKSLRSQTMASTSTVVLTGRVCWGQEGVLFALATSLISATRHHQRSNDHKHVISPRETYIVATQLRTVRH
jgi:hypothetical protein